MAAKQPYAGRKLTFWRENRDMSVAKLAEKTGLPVRSIYAYERLTNDIPWDKACILAKALGIRVGLLWDAEPPPDEGPSERRRPDEV